MPLYHSGLACVAGVIEEGEGERGRREKNNPPHFFSASSLPFPFPDYAGHAGYSGLKAMFASCTHQSCMVFLALSISKVTWSDSFLTSVVPSATGWYQWKPTVRRLPSPSVSAPFYGYYLKLWLHGSEESRNRRWSHRILRVCSCNRKSHLSEFFLWHLLSETRTTLRNCTNLQNHWTARQSLR